MSNPIDPRVLTAMMDEAVAPVRPRPDALPVIHRGVRRRRILRRTTAAVGVVAAVSVSGVAYGAVQSGPSHPGLTGPAGRGHSTAVPTTPCRVPTAIPTTPERTTVPTTPGRAPTAVPTTPGPAPTPTTPCRVPTAAPTTPGRVPTAVPATPGRPPMATPTTPSRAPTAEPGTGS
jgi:hypothetical protein